MRLEEVIIFATRHLRRFNLTTPADVFNKCAPTAWQLFKAGVRADHNVRILRFEGFKGTNKYALRKWQAVRTRNWCHYVCEIDGWVIDPTAAQFDSRVRSVFVKRTKAYSRQWIGVSDVTPEPSWD